MSSEAHPAEQELPRIHIAVEQAQAGEWVMPTVSYIDPVRRFCAMTGRPIARRYWQVMVGEVELVFAGPAEALRYATYPLSTDAQETPSSTRTTIGIEGFN
jgi:hypothetical protein